jgi:hypothetical protein
VKATVRNPVTDGCPSDLAKMLVEARWRALSGYDQAGRGKRGGAEIRMCVRPA